MIKISEPARVKNIDFEILFGLEKGSSILIFLDGLKLDVLNYFIESDYPLALVSKNEKRIEKARRACFNSGIHNTQFLSYKKLSEIVRGEVQYDFIIKNGTGGLFAIKRILKTDGRICFLCRNFLFTTYFLNKYFCKKNGFSDLRFFWPYPGNYNYIWIMPLGSYKVIRQFIGLVLRDYDIFKVKLMRLFLRVTIALRILKWIVPNYVALATR